MAKIETRTVLSEGTEPSLENSTFYIKDYQKHRCFQHLSSRGRLVSTGKRVAQSFTLTRV